MDTGNDQASEEELRALSARLFEEGVRMMRLKPMPRIRDSVRGLPEVMRILCMSGRPMSPSELARKSGVTDARIANILKALESRGLIERRPGEHDRRRVVVSVTDYGRAQERARAQEGSRFLIDFLSELGLDDARELVRIIARVNEVIERRHEEGRDTHPSDPTGVAGDILETSTRPDVQGGARA